MSKPGHSCLAMVFRSLERTFGPLAPATRVLNRLNIRDGKVACRLLFYYSFFFLLTGATTPRYGLVKNKKKGIEKGHQQQQTGAAVRARLSKVSPSCLCESGFFFHLIMVWLFLGSGGHSKFALLSCGHLLFIQTEKSVERSGMGGAMRSLYQEVDRKPFPLTMPIYISIYSYLSGCSGIRQYILGWTQSISRPRTANSTCIKSAFYPEIRG